MHLVARLLHERRRETRQQAFEFEADRKRVLRLPALLDERRETQER